MEPECLLEKEVTWKQCVESHSMHEKNYSTAAHTLAPTPKRHREAHERSLSRLVSPVTQSCPTLCNPMNCSTPGLPVHHQFPEFTQTHVHWVGDAIQPSHPLSSPSPPALNLSQHQGLFKWVSFFASSGQSIRVAASTSVLPMNTQDLFISLQSKRLSRVFSNSTVQKHSSAPRLVGQV